MWKNRLSVESSPGRAHSQLSVFYFTGQRCNGDRSVFCRMDALKRYCALPDFQRMCCKSCSNVTLTELQSNTTTRSTPITSIQPSITTPPATSAVSSGFTTVQPTILASSTIDTWTTTHPPTFTTAAPHSTPFPQSSAQVLTTLAATSGSVPSTTFSEPGSTDMTTTYSVMSPPIPLPIPDVDDDAATQVPSPTDIPTTSVATTTTNPLTMTSSAITDPTEIRTTLDTLLKSKPKKISLPKKNPKKTLPPKISVKKNIAPKNATKKDVPPKVNPKKKTNTPANKKPQGNGNPKKNTTEKTTPKKTTPANTAPKKTTTAKATPKKTTPKNTPPKNTSPKKITPKNNTLSNNTPKKTPVKKTPVQKPKPPPKKNVPPKASPKKNTQPKTANRKPTQTKANPTEKPKPGPKNVKNLQANSNQKKATEKKTNPKKKMPQTTPSYYTTTTSPYTNPGQMRDFFSTITSGTSIYATATDTPFTESGVSVTYISNNTTPTEEFSLWYHDASATTPSTFDDVTTPHVEDVYIPSGTTPYSDTNSGDVMVTSGSIISDDDIAVSYSNGGVVSDTMVLDDGLTMVIPTINSEDMSDLASSTLLDLSEYIPVTVPVPMSMPDLTTATPTTGKQVSTTTPTLRAKGRPDENSDNNSVDVLYNRIVGVDNDVSQNNLIPKRRVSFRERTKNKRIQELLEEKRNFLLRMKRGHAA